MARRPMGVALKNRSGWLASKLADARRAVVMLCAHAGRRGGRRGVAFHTARPSEALRQTRRARATTSPRGGVPPRPTRCTRHIVCFAKSAPRFHPLAVVSSIASPICLQGFGLLDPFAKISLWVARQRTAPALPHSMTRSAPRRASVQSFANCDGGGYDRLRPVSCERQPSRIEQRTSAHASTRTFSLCRACADCRRCCYQRFIANPAQSVT